MRKIVIAALMSVFVSGTAVAADSPYVGASVGRSSTGNVGTGVLTKSTDTVGGIFLGYLFNKNWGFEAQYTGLGKYAGTAPGATFSGKADALSLAVLGVIPASDMVSVYGKLGVARTKTDASSIPAQLGGASRTAATFGLGAQFSVNPSIGIRIGWDRYGIATTGATIPGSKHHSNVNIYSLGVAFAF